MRLIKQSADMRPQITLNAKKALELGLAKKKQAYISFGNRKRYVDVRISDSLAEEDIQLSENVITELFLPEYAAYEIRADKNEITMGPFIGLLVRNNDEALNQKYLSKMLLYAKNYAAVKGAMVVFALDKVDAVKLVIEGYCYDPTSGGWQRGVFPYPCAIYRTIGLNTYWKNHFLSAIGDKVFNSLYFNKREMYEWLSADPSINPHLPHTILYKAHKDIPDMLDRFGTIYIKPVSGLKGRGVVRVSREEGLMVFRYREGGKNRQLAPDSPEEVRQFIDGSLKYRKYLIQQAIQLIQYEGGVTDFRCVLQKNKSDAWEFMAMFGRRGEKDSIVSNISSGGAPFKGDDLLKMAIAPYKMDFRGIRDEIRRLALAVCATLDEFGFNCGVLGLDIGLDINGHIWLIEINNRDPSMVFAKDIGDEELYNRLKTNPVFYAKALAGFKD